MLKALVVSASVVSTVEAFAGGSGTCDAVLTASNPSGMKNRGRETTDGGYTFKATPPLTEGYTAGATYEIELSNPAKDINGFIAYAVSSGADPSLDPRQGTVAAGPTSKVSAADNCGTMKTVTHSSGDAKPSVSFSWTAPSAGTGDVDMVGIAYSTSDSAFYAPKLIVAEKAVAPTQTIYEIISTSGEHTELTAAIDANAEVKAFLDACTTCTVFAPTDTAFPDVLPDNIADILKFHAVDSTVPSSAAVEASTFLPTALAKSLRVWKTDSGVFVAGQGSLGEPNGAAQVTQADLFASNGVVHVIDGVLMPIENVETSSQIFAAIYGQLFQLYPKIGALLGVDQTLTIFAPSELAVTTNLALLSDPSTDVEALLSYHLVPGEAKFFNDFSEGQTTLATGLTGKSLTVTKTGEEFKVNNLIVTAQADVFCTNGVNNIAMHFIDGLLDSTETPAPTATPTAAPTDLSAAPNVSPVGYLGGAASLLAALALF